MSLDVRYFTNGEKTAFTVLHTDTGEVEAYQRREDIPLEIRHLFRDREAWTAEWKDFRGKPKCSACNRVFPEEYFQWAFCPGCGRAMKPDAWAVLEKMVRGCMG